MTTRRLGCLAVTLGVALLAVTALLLASHTAAGRTVRNVAEYRVRSLLWSVAGQPGFDPSQAGSLAGTVRDQDGAPVEGAIALVSTIRGEVYLDHSDARGRFRIDGIPPGRYVPLAGAWGYEPASGPMTEVTAGRQVADSAFTLTAYTPSPVKPTALRLGQAVTAGSSFPEPMIATRIPFTFTQDGLTIDNGQIYLPAHRSLPPQAEVQQLALPTLVIIYPSHPLNWDAASVALTRDSFAVLALGPDGDRGLDIEGHARDFRAALKLWQAGSLEPLRPVDDQWVLMSGSFGSLILFRALRDLADVPAIVNVGGVSDAFLGVQALYSTELAIPPPYDTAIAAMGRPDRDPAFFFRYSPVFFAAHLPPTFVIHTYNDEVIPYNQAETLARALQAANVPHELLLYEDTTHYLDAYNPTPGTHMVYERVLDWVGERLGNGE